MRNIDLYQHDYLDNPFEEHLIACRHKKAAEVMATKKARHILEIGCGLKPIYRYYDDYSTLTIIEPSTLFVEKLRGDQPHSVRWINDELKVDHIQDLAGQFDFIAVSSLLHELDDPEALLRTVAEIAAPRTSIHINVPNANSFHRLLAQEMGLIADVFELSERQVRFQQSSTFDIATLTDLVERCGLSIEESGSLFMKPFTHRQMQEMLNTNTIDARVIDGLSTLTKHFPDHGAELYLNASKNR